MSAEPEERRLMMATGKGTDAFRYDEQIVRCDDCEATGPLCEMDNGEGWEADRLHGGDTVPLGLHVHLQGRLARSPDLLAVDAGRSAAH